MTKCTHYNVNWGTWWTVKHTNETKCDAIAEHIAGLETWITKLTTEPNWYPESTNTKSKVSSFRTTIDYLKSSYT